MKNHDRAVIVGETTFGKGSVQLVFNDMPDKAALKLTIAQYLTEPGDISIQGTGITPDIELDPMTVDNLEMDLAVDGTTLKERDLSRSLSNSRAHDGGRPTETLRYDLSQKDRQELRERGGDPDENFALDFPIKFARDLASRVPQGTRPDQVRAAKPLIEATRAAELAKVAAELGKMGIDWSDAPAGDTPQTAPPLDVKIETDRPNNEVSAGDPMTAQGHRHEQRHRAGVPALRDDEERQRDVREQGARLRQARPGQVEDRDRAARLVRRRRPQIRLDRRLAEGRAARLQAAEERAHPRRRHQAPLRRGAQLRSRSPSPTHASRRRRSSARRSRTRTKSSTTATATATAASKRARR